MIDSVRKANFAWRAFFERKAIDESMKECKKRGKMTNHMLLYHAGFETIQNPDIHYGRKNADFGQGFYLTSSKEFAYRWAKEEKGRRTIVNRYDLDTTGLVVERFSRTAVWFEYIGGNRRLKPDGLQADVIIGPIANDTIYNTYGIITSGFLKPEEALRLLRIGPEYEQIVLKSEKAAAQLIWLSAEAVPSGVTAEYKKTLAVEEEEYQRLFAQAFEEMNN